jgi:S-methylmethionine-dependent homocysteine/selenocysteine methylase
VTTTPLATLLAKKRPLILDGAMGTELQRRGANTLLPLWSAEALVLSPALVRQIHEEYIRAGADIITANTFRTTRRTFVRTGLPDRSLRLTTTALSLARQARETFPHQDILVAGSIAPLEDCYRPELVPLRRALEEEHAELAGRLAEGGADFLLLETMGTIREAAAACKAAAATGKEVVVSFLCNENGDLYGGESLHDAVSAILPFAPTALSINCVSPRVIEKAVARLRSASSLPFGVYANVGVPGKEHSEPMSCDVTEEEYSAFALQWSHHGAAIIGGCCGTTPAYIRKLVEALGSKVGDSK